MNVDPYVMSAFAIINLTKTLTAASGLLSSARFTVDLTTPINVNTTSSARPPAIRPAFIALITLQTAPPMKSSRPVVSMLQVSPINLLNIFTA